MFLLKLGNQSHWLAFAGGPILLSALAAAMSPAIGAGVLLLSGFLSLSVLACTDFLEDAAKRGAALDRICLPYKNTEMFTFLAECLRGPTRRSLAAQRFTNLCRVGLSGGGEMEIEAKPHSSTIEITLRAGDEWIVLTLPRDTADWDACTLASTCPAFHADTPVLSRLGAEGLICLRSIVSGKMPAALSDSPKIGKPSSPDGLPTPSASVVAAVRGAALRLSGACLDERAAALCFGIQAAMDDVEVLADDPQAAGRVEALLDHVLPSLLVLLDNQTAMAAVKRKDLLSDAMETGMEALETGRRLLDEHLGLALSPMGDRSKEAAAMMDFVSRTVDLRRTA